MWSQILLCLLVPLAFATQNPGWDEQNHYVYEVRGRSLAGLNQISSEYSGIVYKAKLEIQPRSDGNLGAKIADAQYAQLQGKLDDGWDEYIPDSAFNYQRLPLSDKPFQIVMRNGVIKNIIVSNQIKNWEANIHKSIVSQLQFDTKAENVMKSSINTLSQDDTNTAVFKTMEETVTGVTETLYEIHPYPEYVLQSKPWMVPQKHLSREGNIIEIIKTKNFTHSSQSPSYHAGFEGINGYQPGNEIGKFLSRTSVNQAVITGNLQKFIIQSSVTIEKITLSPTFDDEERGSVSTSLNITLKSISKSSGDGQFQVDNGVEVGVVYRYNNPFDTNNGPRPAKEYDHSVEESSAESDSPRDSLGRSSSGGGNPIYDDDDEDWYQSKPKIGDAPPSPLLPFTVGHDGQSIKKTLNIIDTVYKLAQEIGQEFPEPEKVLHQQTIAKFVTLTSLVRIMGKDEIQQVGESLHGNSQSHGWTAFRDAVAEAGTGPAIVNIKKWIQEGKVSDFEAAQIIYTAANSARQPTEEYIKFFHGMLEDDKIMDKPYLNETALLSYTTLVRQVYGNKQESHGKYPVYTYGSFRTSRGQEYVKKTVISALTRQLNKAVINADTRKIHAYIRALGNIGQREILETFEPYLEGQKKMSHFQRVLMITALDQLVRSNPRVARSVLYKVYQNPSESEQVRVAAVYQLMHTRPSASMLQRMAAYTNVDASSYVNAAVQSSIESASQLESPEDYELSAAAESAKSLLTSEQYGAHYSQGYLRSYVEEESQLTYQEHAKTYGGEDHNTPKGFAYMLKQQIGGYNSQLVDIRAMVSSVEDLVNVFQQQTKIYQQQQKEKQDEKGENTQWSSEYIAQMLGLENEQREQLEGNLYLHWGALQSILSLDNHTMEHLAKDIQKLEEELRQGKNYEYSKMSNCRESALAFPTALGLPFLYTYDRPMFVRSKIFVKASAQPAFSEGQALQKPDTIEAKFEINAEISSRIQTQFGIFTPFDHQSYSAGYTKNYQLIVPLRGQMTLNVQRRQMKIDVQNPGSKQDARLAHYSSWPYTAQHDVYTLNPKLRIIKSEDPYKRNIVVGDKSTGVAVYLKITSDEKIDYVFVYEKLTSDNAMTAILRPWVDEKIQYTHIDVGIDSSNSPTEQVTLRLGYQTDYQQNDPTAKKPTSHEQVRDIPQFPDDPEKRQQQFIDRLGSNINNAEVYVGDATVELSGKSKIKYSLTAGVAKSNADPEGHFMALVRKFDKQNPEILAYIQGLSKVPNTNGLDLDYAMQMNPTSMITVQGLLRRQQTLSRADTEIEFAKSKERTEYLTKQNDYKECKRQMEKGNTQLPICAKATAKANLLDKFSLKMTYENMDRYIANTTYKAYSILRHILYPRVDENIIDRESNKDFKMSGQFSPDLEYVNVSIASEYGKSEIKNAPVNKWVREIFVPHPVFHTRARLEAQYRKYDAYRPICVVDKTHASTFDNKTYPASLSPSWTVVLQYVPRRPSSEPKKPDQSVPKQLRKTIESYIVYSRADQDGSSKKEVQVVLQTPATQGKIAKIVLQPANRGSKAPKVLVNEQQVHYTTESSFDFYNGHIQIYELPNQEVKVEFREAFYIIFNGQTLKLTAVNSKFRDATRGLCGTFTGEPETDFLDPRNCILKDPQEFVHSYTIESQGKPAKYGGAGKCYQRKVEFADYISNNDIGLSGDYDKRGDEECTGHISRYAEQTDEICFTIRALPYCKTDCVALDGQKTKKVDVHCLPHSANTGYWRARLESGINVDFTMMTPTHKLPMATPSRCVSKDPWESY